jgi:hypothetical protein
LKAENNDKSPCTMLIDDNDRDGLQAGKEAGQENPTGKSPGEFTRLFLADQGGQVSPTPDIRAEPPGTSSTPGEFTSLFTTQDQDNLAVTKGGADDLAAGQPVKDKSQPSTMPSFSATGEFTKVLGEPFPIAEPSSFKQEESFTDEFPRQELAQANSALPAPGVGRTVEPAAVSQEILEEAFRHPLTPRAVEPLNLQPSSASRQDDPKPRGFTQLFNAAPVSTTSQGSLNTVNVRAEVRGAPSDFTRVVRSSEVRQALEKTASQPAPSSPGPQGIPPVVPQLQTPVLQYQPPQIPQPQYAPPQMPAQPVMQYPVPVQQVYSPQMPQPPQVPGLHIPGPQPLVPPQTQEPSPSSKWVAYLPILIVINVLFMVAVLLILFFALRH